MRLDRAAIAALALGATPALAADLPLESQPSSLPSLAATPGALSPDWSGLYVGSGVIVAAARGAKGGVGGEAYAGWSRRLDDGLLIGLRGEAGVSPLLGAPSFANVNALAYGAAEAKLGYPIGRLTPYVLAGVAFAKPTRVGGGFQGAGDAIDDLFSGPGADKPAGTFGVGFDYAVTNRLSVGVEARVYGAGAYPAGSPFWR